jgi:flagellar hook-length control protein FliK
MQALLVQFLGLAANPVAPTMTQAQAQADLAPASRSIRPGQPLQATTLAQSAGVVKAALGSATVAAPAGAINAVPTGSAVDSTAGAAAVGHATTMRWQPQADASAAVATAKTSALPETLGVATSRVALGGETGSAHTSLAAAWNSTVAAQSAAPQMPGGAAVPVLRDVTQESLSLPATDGLTQAAAVTSLVASLSESELGMNAHKRGGARAEPVAVDVPAVSGTGVSAPSASVASAATSAVAASGQGLEQTVAEQVKYWISNDVHNAQLKFDGLGAAAVQVNISMSGTQAQVVFQSDQAHTRELLGNAMTQLDQMLRGQGLTLTAAWVGSSGQQGQFGAQSQSPQSGPLPASEAAPLQSIAVAPTARRNVAPTDRALDLFV